MAHSTYPESIKMKTLKGKSSTDQDQTNSLENIPDDRKNAGKTKFGTLSKKFNKKVNPPKHYKEKFQKLKFNTSFDAIPEADETDELRTNQLNQNIEENNNSSAKKPDLASDFKWPKLKFKKQRKTLKKIKKNISSIEKKIIKITTKIENAVLSELKLREQFSLCHEFLTKADAYMYVASGMTDDLKYNEWYLIFQDSKIRFAGIEPHDLIEFASLINEELVVFEDEFSDIKAKYLPEVEIDDEEKLNALCSLTTDLEDEMCKIKKRADENLYRMNKVLELKYNIVVRIHKLCLKLIKLLDELVSYFIVTNFDFAKETICFRGELMHLANYSR